MDESSQVQKNYFLRQHLRLLNFAAWAKYLAWAVLIVFILSGGVQTFEFVQKLKHPEWNSLSDIFMSGANVVTTVLSGVVYYLLLKGVSLGLNMIVETNVNYRDRKQEEAQ